MFHLGLKNNIWSYLICSLEPPEVALVMAHAASFLVRNSATCRILIRGGSRPASITIYKKNLNVHLKTTGFNILHVKATHEHTCICARFPAVILEIVQQASFLMDSLGLLRRCNRDCNAEQFRITLTIR